MNKYALYCKDTKQSFGPFVAVCADNFQSKVKKREVEDLQRELYLLKCYRMSFALVDQNGAVLIRDLKISRVELEDSQVAIKTYKDLSL